MKIVYAADNRLGAAHQLHDFIKNTTHEVKVAAYPKSGRLLEYIDWNLDAAKNNQQLCKDIKEYYPDFVLIDCEPIVASIAYQLDIPILYCSSLHILDGLVWARDNRGYSYTLEELRRKVNKLPPGVSKLIYSPFGDLQTPPKLRDGFEWIEPYYSITKRSEENCILFLIEDPTRIKSFNKIINSSKLCRIINEKVSNNSYTSNLGDASSLLIEGNTRHLADGIYNHKRICLAPKIKDAEHSLNAILCSKYNVGVDLGQIELIGRDAQEKIENALNDHTPSMIANAGNYKKLHERINELWECM